MNKKNSLRRLYGREMKLRLSTIMTSKGFLCSFIIALAMQSPSFAGGGACRFDDGGVRVLSESPIMREAITSKFKVSDMGAMGPIDAPFDGRRLYTYMEFRATAIMNQEERFIIRIHFKSMGEQTLERVEIIPQKTPTK